MQAYLVRVTETHEVVGIFVTETRAGLFWAVDECCDPCRTEYVVAGPGGFYVSSPTAARWPDPREPEDMTDGDLSGGCLSERWTGKLDGDWRPVV